PWSSASQRFRRAALRKAHASAGVTGGDPRCAAKATVAPASAANQRPTTRRRTGESPIARSGCMLVTVISCTFSLWRPDANTIRGDLNTPRDNPGRVASALRPGHDPSEGCRKGACHDDPRELPLRGRGVGERRGTRLHVALPLLPLSQGARVGVLDRRDV